MAKVRLLLTIGVISALGAAECAGQDVAAGEAPVEGLAAGRGAAWPATLLARPLQAVAGEFAVYANSNGVACSLQAYLERGLATHDPTWAHGAFPIGAVVALAPGDEPLAALADWANQYVERDRPIDWVNPERGEHLISTNGRPYCAGPAYFQESFAVPLAAVAALDPGARLPRECAWVCVATTDEHWRAGFDAAVAAWRGRVEAVEREAPDVAAGLVALVMRGGYELFIVPGYRSIDRELMQLQRIEAVQLARIAAAYAGSSDCRQYETTYQAQIDWQWRELWRSRPLD